MTNALVTKVEKCSSCPAHYPAACFELFHASTASYIVAAMQMFMLVIMGLTYYALEKHGYFVNVDAFRPVVACIGTLYAGGVICADKMTPTGSSLDLKRAEARIKSEENAKK
ncbi:hypothetical protein NECAME_03858 [Necator americanus]|uniref:Uncharacterized protein n=1 Tax=Necator americanus TaxID=51031 RepID=W2SZG6_NECAM|nr:hypothetical protein NECAME_03858 [Necator americanus]ETN75135.1 hypothetical protein NECAME_03858 [Necator americanus]